ncbi:Collagen triple helix repeat [uncultured Caudovirales phage]|uniref:Collagen triple helix repeat n=1 Tax=uncultured Caudovirales phage TaxID=2100421 RepID=A0A6J5QNA3_9CAUD|nr:Collagen triple helix repeat [uncultured Caudovirales phage]
MAIKIRLPYNTSSGVLPTNTNLVLGELAVNTADGKLFTLNSSGATIQINTTGLTGNTGAQGSAGAQGTQGSQGIQGPTGFAGLTGSQGPAGTQGTQGPQGLQGVATGPQGLAGLQGLTGPQGGTGPQGTQGPQGLQGFRGPTGPGGPLGATGPQGVLGAPGGGGAQGAQGPQGRTGSTGPCVPAPVGVCAGGGTCFLGSSYTTMADGSRKMMRDVRVGDWLMGAFGEANQVLALEDLVLGNRPMFVINYTHHTTGDHTHICSDKQFVSLEPEETITNDWNIWYNCVLSDGSFVMLYNKGIDNPQDRLGKLDLGIVLQTVDGGKEVEQIDSYDLPYDTKLYNFVMSGSHTYFADGYAVTGWPRDDDFDYVQWKQIGETSKIEDWMTPKLHGVN